MYPRALSTFLTSISYVTGMRGFVKGNLVMMGLARMYDLHFAHEKDFFQFGCPSTVTVSEL